jgi:hypothetical protein
VTPPIKSKVDATRRQLSTSDQVSNGEPAKQANATMRFEAAAALPVQVVALCAANGLHLLRVPSALIPQPVYHTQPTCGRVAHKWPSNFRVAEQPARGRATVPQPPTLNVRAALRPRLRCCSSPLPTTAQSSSSARPSSPAPQPDHPAQPFSPPLQPSSSRLIQYQHRGYFLWVSLFFIYRAKCIQSVAQFESIA